ncbi:MAG: penicillin-binding protein 2 [Verrucomicrobiota bacterium]|jgi:penicillin-binding protein 2
MPDRRRFPRFPEFHRFALLGAFWACQIAAQEGSGTSQPAGVGAGTGGAGSELPAAPKPSWQTQKQARTYVLSIPAPRGQIVDRTGEPLAQTRVSYNLGISFPTPHQFTERGAVEYVRAQAAAAGALLGRSFPVSEAGVARHYLNRPALPYILAQDLKEGEVEKVEGARSETLVLSPVYQRHYPHGTLAGHVIGYAGRSLRLPDGPLENNGLLWPEAKGGDGLEQSFDSWLQGRLGQYNLTFDNQGRKTSEQVSIAPEAGNNVVTTLDLQIQRLAEESLRKGCKRGALVFVDPYTGDVLALASWPPLDPNQFLPGISSEGFAALEKDPDQPLYPRAFRASYPPGSTFKVVVGLAGLQTGKVAPDDEMDCPPAMTLGKLTFRNWQKKEGGMLNFVGALTQSCNTWFFQAGERIGAKDILDYASQLGLGAKSGIPLRAEEDGLVPSDEQMLKTHGRKILKGDLYNISIGQGDLLVSPLQMTLAMAAIGNGGYLMRPRLVQQIQEPSGKIVRGYDPRARNQIEIRKEVLDQIKTAMVQVVEGRNGTAGRAQIDGVQVAGKTGTAQSGAKPRERTVAWFTGFAPAQRPKYAFTAVYEGDANNNDVHGGSSAAPLVAHVLKELLKPAPKQPKKAVSPRAEDGVPVRKAERIDPGGNP